MSKVSDNKMKVESWTLNRGTRNESVVTKVAVRNSLGQFHGATNFRGSVLTKSLAQKQQAVLRAV